MELDEKLIQEINDILLDIELRQILAESSDDLQITYYNLPALEKDCTETKEREEEKVQIFQRMPEPQEDATSVGMRIACVLVIVVSFAMVFAYCVLGFPFDP